MSLLPRHHIASQLRTYTCASFEGTRRACVRNRVFTAIRWTFETTLHTARAVVPSPSPPQRPTRFAWRQSLSSTVFPLLEHCLVPFRALVWVSHTSQLILETGEMPAITTISTQPNAHAANPAWWPSDHRRVPRYRQVQYHPEWHELSGSSMTMTEQTSHTCMSCIAAVEYARRRDDTRLPPHLHLPRVGHAVFSPRGPLLGSPPACIHSMW